MSSAPATARQLLERTGDHPVISLYFDLDPEEFATAPARATQARALIDEANRIVEADESLDHDDRSSLASDVSRLDDYLASEDLPVSGVRALAIFSSRETDLFETVTLSRPTASNVFISRNPHVEPLVVQGDDEHWCAVLVTSRTGRVYRGRALQVTAEEKIEDYVRGHSQGGAAGENTQEQDIEGHLRNLARAIYHDWQREPFSTLALSGPVESAARLQELLHNDLRPTLAASHLDVDVASATASDLEAAIAEVLDAKRQADAGRALEALTETTRAVTGLADTLEALNERRSISWPTSARRQCRLPSCRCGVDRVRRAAGRARTRTADRGAVALLSAEVHRAFAGRRSDNAAMSPPFRSLYRHGYVRVAAAVPHVRVGDPGFNAEHTAGLARRAHETGAAVVVFPELGLAGYSSEDLFHQAALLDAVEAALQHLVAVSVDLRPVLLVGAPVRAEGGLFNAAIAVHRGQILGATPKSYVPEYHEYYEKRQFRAARDLIGDRLTLLGSTVPFGPDLIYACRDVRDFALHVEICEDLWSPIAPSTYGALAGATVLSNLSASNITIGKAGFRRMLCESQSAKTVSAYVFAAAGLGESTTDVAWDGQALICENGDLLAEGERFSDDEQLIVGDVDLDRILSDRMSISSYGDTIGDERERLRTLRRIDFELDSHSTPEASETLSRRVERFPYVPSDPASRNERCEEVYNIQVRGLETRLLATGIKKIVIGVSGGLDSTHALIVAARAVDRLGLPRTNVLGYTLPGFATSARTLENAHALMKALGVTAAELDIRPSATQMLRDLQHPAAEGEPQYDVTYENVQAGERTSHLFRLANYHDALVLGTGDLSELALGWSTYGVGDQMSHYNVNASVPKTLIRFLLRWAISANLFGEEANQVLASVLETAISPELVPGGEDAGDGPHQDSEQTVGPYELQDFFLYYILRFGYRPSKVAFLAEYAWGDRSRGDWPDLIPEDRRNQYSLREIRHWLEVFLLRFFATSQFKRSAMPNAPKVGSGGSLSPRSDWRAPSDGNATAWLQELREGVEEE